ncbi:MAG: cbb3-type cytochrome c oxidase subunit 3 [Pseudomonadota bacterium]
MTPTLISLIGLTLTAVGITWWAYAPSQRSRWNEAANLPFKELPSEESEL